eukprot:scpid88484/ scgid21184/ 
MCSKLQCPVGANIAACFPYTAMLVLILVSITAFPVTSAMAVPNGDLRGISTEARTLPVKRNGVLPIGRMSNTRSPAVSVTLADAETVPSNTGSRTEEPAEPAPTTARRLHPGCSRKTRMGNITLAKCSKVSVDVGTCDGACMSKDGPSLQSDGRNMTQQADGVFSAGMKKRCRCCTAVMETRNATLQCVTDTNEAQIRWVQYKAVASCACRRCSFVQEAKSKTSQ